jgi:hypothetical protein
MIVARHEVPVPEGHGRGAYDSSPAIYRRVRTTSGRIPEGRLQFGHLQGLPTPEGPAPKGL